MSKDPIVKNQMSSIYSFNIETSDQLTKILTGEGVSLPMDIDINQMINIRLLILTHHLKQIPFDIIKIDDYWFIDKIFHENLSSYFKQGDRLLIINKTTITNQLQEEEIFKLILYSAIPFIVWVISDPNTYLKYQKTSEQYLKENAYVDAKAYLLKTKYYDEISLYDHLALFIANAIKNPPNNISDLFENFDQRIYYPILKSNLRSVEDKTDLTIMKRYAQLLKEKEQSLLKSNNDIIKSLPNLAELAYFCSSSGYGIHPNEFILILSEMKRLNSQINCSEMKFWGKIFGVYCDYYIIQIQHEKEILFDEIDINNRKRIVTTEKTSKPFFTEISKKWPVTDINQYTYFVTNSPGLPWIKLPNVKPSIINQARTIRCLFTGCLSREIEGFSPDFGFEKEYLRAQIARITATTHISPAGFYILRENMGKEEKTSDNSNERKDSNIIHNPEFNNDPKHSMTAKFLANRNLEQWVHSLPEILLLQQQPTQYWDPQSVATTNFSRIEEHENNTQTAAPLLRPIADDKLLCTNQPSWSIGLTMFIMRKYSLCYVRSNVWPGAFTLGHARNYFNFYVGWGQKYEYIDPCQISPSPEKEFQEQLMEENDSFIEVEKPIDEARYDISPDSTSRDEEDYDEQFNDEYYY